MNKQAILIKRTNSLYPNSVIDDGAITLMGEWLSDIPPEELAATLRALVRESRFMPLVADIVAKHRTLYPQPVEVEASWIP